MKYRSNRGFTLIELTIVVVIIAVLTVVVIPQFSNSTDDSRKRTAEISLSTVRSLLEAYRVQHDGLPVIDDHRGLADALTYQTTRVDTVDANTARQELSLAQFPENPYSGSNAVKTIAGERAVPGDVTPGNSGGWLYNVSTGGFWLDRNPGFDW